MFHHVSVYRIHNLLWIWFCDFILLYLLIGFLFLGISYFLGDFDAEENENAILQEQINIES